MQVTKASGTVGIDARLFTLLPTQDDISLVFGHIDANRGTDCYLAGFLHEKVSSLVLCQFIHAYGTLQRESRAHLAGWDHPCMQAQLSTRGFRYRSSLGRPGTRHGTHLRGELMAQGTGQLHHACCARLLRSLSVYLVLSSSFYDTRDRGRVDAGWGRLRCPGIERVRT